MKKETIRTCSAKISRLIIEKILKDCLTANQIILFIYLILRQDPFGNVEGCYYRDIALAEGFCNTTYYNSIETLRKKGYIEVVRRNSDSLDIRILNNEFKDKKDDEKGYLNIKKEILTSWDFKRLKANEMKIVLLLLLNSNIYKNGCKFTPQTIAKWIGVKSKSMAIIYRYCENINMFFPNYRTDGKKSNLIVFKPFPEESLRDSFKSDKEIFYEHKIKNICRVYKVNYTLKDLKDLIIVISQYSKKGIGKLFNTIMHVLISKRSIEPKLINFLLNKDAKIDSKAINEEMLGKSTLIDNDIVPMDTETEEVKHKVVKTKARTRFHNFDGRSEMYSNDDLENIARKKRKEYLAKLKTT